MRFLIFNGSLKPDAESNTFSVCKMLQLAFVKLGHECDIVTLRDLDYNFFFQISFYFLKTYQTKQKN